MYKNFKPGMTLGELCMVFAIMGVIASMMIISAKPYEKSLKYSYEKVYHTLETAFYNAQLNLLPTDIQGNDAKRNAENFVAGGAVYAVDIDKPTFPLNTYTFCKMLLEYINTKDGTSDKCNSNPIVYGVESGDFHDSISKTDGKISSEPFFVASNGVRYWISSLKTDEDSVLSSSTNFELEDGTMHTVRYYIVYADLNGDMPPNTTQWTEKRPADIVPFIVTEDADVIPVGYPVVDTRYMTAQVIFNTVRNDGDEYKQELSVPMPYFKAIRTAWGNGKKYDDFYETADNTRSLNFQAKFIDSDYGPLSVPVSYLQDSAKDTSAKIVQFDSRCGQVQNAENIDPNACDIKIKNYH